MRSTTDGFRHVWRFARILVLSAVVMVPTASGRGAEAAGGPSIQQDPHANITDVYAFVGTKFDDPAEVVLNVLVQVRPFSDPASDVRFADEVLYSIHVTHPRTGRTTLRYDFRFSDVSPDEAPGLKNPDTILAYGNGTSFGPIASVGGPRQNYTQTYAVDRDGSLIGDGLAVPPQNVGVRTTPAYNDAVTGRAVSGAVDSSELDVYTQESIHELSTGEVVFAGLREDGFYADMPGIFDLLDPRLLGNTGGGVDGRKGFNVLCYAIQIPLALLRPAEYEDPFSGPATGVGVYASTSRRLLSFRRRDGSTVSLGPFRQIRRMGNPLFNELFVALSDQDLYDATPPTRDASLFETYALEPELADLFNTVFNAGVATANRSDLRELYVPDVLRVNTTTAPVPLPGETGFDRLSVFGGDQTNGVPSGWPNGRRIGDDVVDILFTAIASGPSYGSITLRGDDVNANDQIYNQVFPYLGTPHAGAAVDQRQAP